MDKQKTASSMHAETFDELLPLYANGSLRGRQRVALERHLQTCRDCCRQLEQELRNVELLRKTALPSRSPESGLQQLLARIDSAKRGPVVASEPGLLASSLGWLRESRWSRGLAGAGAFTLVLGLSIALLRGYLPEETSYHVLGEAGSAADPAVDEIRLVLANDVSEQRRQALLDAIGGRIVAEPNMAGAITVRIDPLRSQLSISDTLDLLRREAGVLLAEAATPEAVPHIGPEQL